MTHIVIHDDASTATQYRQFDDLGNAVRFLEELRNTAGVEDAKLFALDEVVFEMKPYFKFQVVDEAAPAAEIEPARVEPIPVEPAPAPVASVEDLLSADPLRTPEVPAEAVADVLPTTDDVSFVEAAMQAPIETIGTELLDTPSDFAPPAADDDSSPVTGGDVRRGLFGR